MAGDPLARVRAAMRALEDAQAEVPAAQVEAARIVSDARAAVQDRRARLADAIAAAAAAGVRQVELVQLTGLTRERIRQICRERGVESPRNGR